ncbi:secondary thiamine-phosphate synthase enzyme YjbQ [Patescibacteria group bacterium]|nr:secondary thiamine-phosphate synthase enzyme YjbQ [Patescibacteria group bacterium]
MIKEFEVLTKERYELINITNKVERIVRESKVRDGLCFVFAPHSTAGIVLTEDESGLKNDWLAVLKKMVSGFDFFHNRIDNNADSHILSGLIGQEKTLVIENNKLIRGTWQNIFLIEFDGPRTRKVIVKT